MRLYVGNIRWSASDDDLRRFFAQAGDVSAVEIVRNPLTGRSRGFAFIDMPNEGEAAIAIERLNGADFRGLPVRVGHARPRPR